MNKTIILSIATIAVISFSGCGNKSNNEEGTNNSVTEAVNKAKETTQKVAQKTKEAATATTEAVKEGVDKAKEAATKVADKTKETATATTKVVKETAKKAKEAVTGGTNDKGKTVFAKCVTCHGKDGKTKALGKSKVIAGQAVADLEKKIQEYKAGSRNVAGMGQLMNGQVKDLSDEEIKAVSEYISSLK